jgi:hypothetical protein
MERRLKRTNAAVSEQVRVLRRQIEHEFGGWARLWATVAGPALLWTASREEKQLAAGKTYEPPTIIERRNWFGS